MQLPDLSKTQRRIVTCGSIVVAGTLCPVGIGAMAAGVASGIVANDLVAHHYKPPLDAAAECRGKVS